jgi:hypothetical protein
MSLFDRKSGKLLPSIVEPVSYPRFFPTGGRFVARASPYQQEAVYDTQHQQPLAVFEEPGAAAQDGGVEVAGNGRSILIHRTFPGFSGYRLFRQTGWDCPESVAGALAFPQTLLTIILLVGTAVSLLNDARLQAIHAPYRPPGEVVFPLFAVCMLLSCHFAVEACMGHLIRTPAPLLVIACIGMARGSQAWRWIAVLILCGVVAWCGSRAVVLWSVREDFYPLFDRVYAFPHAVGLALAIVTKLVLAATAILLSRSSRIA